MHLNDLNPAWMQGAALNVVIVNSNQIFSASIGDCRCVAATTKGVGKSLVPNIDLSRDHKCDKTAQ
jgi:serine/threonine protein phosphatase PrpC